MVVRVLSVRFWAATISALALPASNVPAHPIKTSICELSSRASFYDGKLVVVPAVVKGSGLHSPALVDRRCMTAARIEFGEGARTRHGHLDRLMTAVHDAFLSSTQDAHRYVQAIFLGTFIARPSGSSNAELRLRDVYSVKIVEDNDLISNIPAPPAH